MTNMKRILKYVSATSDYGLLYFSDTKRVVIGYCDADWARSSEDRKSTSSGFFFSLGIT